MAARSVIRLAAAAYPLEVLPDWDALRRKLRAWVADAVRAGAEVAVFPEYAAMEATLVDGARPKGDTIADWEIAAAKVAAAYHAIVAALAQEFGLFVLSGSGPAWDGDRLVNRAWFCPPVGDARPVDKLMLTPWERANTRLCGGRAPVGFDTNWGRIGVLICYDSEFPDLARRLAPDILLIPACTDAASGQGRLRIAAQARALENQCVTVHAPLLGQVPCPLIDINTGAAGIYTPPDRDLPDDGVLAMGQRDCAGWVMADAPLGVIRQRRKDGEARLRTDRNHVGFGDAMVYQCGPSVG